MYLARTYVLPLKAKKFLITSNVTPLLGITYLLFIKLKNSVNKHFRHTLSDKI